MTRTTHIDTLSPANCTCATLRQAGRVVTQAYEAALAPAGLTNTQFSVLQNLEGHGDLPVSLLAETLVMDRTSLTRTLKPIERQGWIRIVREADQRVRMVQLTSAGLTVLNEALPLWRSVQARMVQGLGEKRWAALLRDLNTTVALIKDG